MRRRERGEPRRAPTRRFHPVRVTPQHLGPSYNGGSDAASTKRGRAMTGQTATATRAKRGARPLSAQETSKLLALTREADTVELKLTVPETRSGFRSTAAALEIDPL